MGSYEDYLASIENGDGLAVDFMAVCTQARSGGFERSGVLYAAYLDWCARGRYAALKRKIWIRAMRDAGFRYGESSGYGVWRDVALRPEWEYVRLPKMTVE